MQTGPAIEFHGVSKSFRVRRACEGGVRARLDTFLAPRPRPVRAVDHLSFSIAPGERVAFIGPNGAGKSTTLKILAGILRQDSGNVRRSASARSSGTSCRHATRSRSSAASASWSPTSIAAGSKR
jgi:ABC-type uncharacterized transport system ATPase subunit